MELDNQIALAKELICKREEIDRQLAELFGGATQTKKGRRCKICGGEGHNAITCPQQKEQEAKS